MNKAWIRKILRPQGKSGVIASLLTTLVVVLLVNLVAYKYLQVQPPNNSLPDTKWGWAFRPVPGFTGINTISGPVDTLLLGDSTCDENLSAGPFADRLGGSTMNLGNINESSFLTDAWMLGDYINRFGPPRNVLVARSSPWGYGRQHDIAFMSAVPLDWGFWDRFGAVPTWQPGELRDLFITKFGVLYSDADILKDRFIKVWDMFKYPIHPVLPSQEYSRGSHDPQGIFDVNNHLPTFYYDKFSPSPDTDIALRYMSNLAREKHFQLYFAFQPEWDEALKAGVRDETLNAQMTYLSQFTDPIYVHIIRDPHLAFQSSQMESPNHLYPEGDHILTEADVDLITSIQNQLTADQAQSLDLVSFKLNKDQYLPGDKPIVTLEIMNRGDKKLSGSVSGLIRLVGESDRNWTLRAPSTSFALPAGGKTTGNIELNAGQITQAGVYDLIIFLRQNVGTLSHETRIEIDKEITVNSPS